MFLARVSSFPLALFIGLLTRLETRLRARFLETEKEGMLALQLVQRTQRVRIFPFEKAPKVESGRASPFLPRFLQDLQWKVGSATAPVSVVCRQDLLPRFTSVSSIGHGGRPGVVDRCWR